MDYVRSFLSNNSVFGRLMNRCGIIITANLLFLVCSIPIVTAGASFTAMYFVMLRTLRGDGNVRVIRTFFGAFRRNFKQATIAWLAILLLAVFLGLELFWCGQIGGVLSLFRYGLTAILIFVVIVAAYLFPTIAAFNGTLKEQLVNSVFFAFTSPLDLVLVMFADVFPVILTYANLTLLPLAAFIWCLCGFGAVAMFCASRMLPRFKPYLDKVDICGDVISAEQEGDPNLVTYEQSEENTLDEMTRYGL